LALNLFDLSASQQSSALTAGRLDFGFIGTRWEAESAHLSHAAIAPCTFQLALPFNHRFARRARIDLALLANDLFLLISDEQFPGASHAMQSACEAAGFRPRILQTAERGHTLLGLVAAGCGVALLPETLRGLPHEGVVFRPAAQPIVFDLCLAWRRGVERALLEKLLAAITA
jgi:DNA-binding transcriptional LysR family regulator